MHANADTQCMASNIRCLDLLLWTLVYMAHIANGEKRVTVSIKWLCALTTQQQGFFCSQACRASIWPLMLTEGTHFPMASGQVTSIS